MCTLSLTAPHSLLSYRVPFRQLSDAYAGKLAGVGALTLPAQRVCVLALVDAACQSLHACAQVCSIVNDACSDFGYPDFRAG